MASLLFERIAAINVKSGIVPSFANAIATFVVTRGSISAAGKSETRGSQDVENGNWCAA